MSAYTVYAVFAVAMAALNVMSIYQPDEVGPEGEFEQAVLDMMNRDKNITKDVAEMLVAVDSLSAAKAKDNLDSVEAELQKYRVKNAMNTMDEVQRITADLYDRCYDDYLDLYPAWRMYLFCDDPKRKNKLYNSYISILTRYNKNQEKLLKNLGALVALEETLLPSNVYTDPDHRIEPSLDSETLLNSF